MKRNLLLLILFVVAAPAFAGSINDISATLMLRAILDNLLLSILLFFVRGALLLVGGFAVFVGTMADLLLDVGIAFGPLLVVLYPILPSTLGSLVSFMLTAAMTKPVAAMVIGGVFTGLSEAVGVMSPLTLDDPFQNVSTAFGILLSLVIAGSLVMAIPSIVSALFGGIAIGGSGAAMRIAGGLGNLQGNQPQGGLKMVRLRQRQPKKRGVVI